ncbi:hypothetical protein GGS26DRAFT_346323 [Hypomontagnella submonticulosa]|nr:hypothetical protein GGS26DRAFT_346323 [Hypomontagnella submonticulosa]
MSTQGGSYAPKSPDLSSFYSGTTSDIQVPQDPNATGGYQYPFQAGLGTGAGAGAGASLRYDNQPQPHQFTSAYQSQVSALSAPQPTQPTSAPAHNNAFSSYNPQVGGRHPGQYYAPLQPAQFNQASQSSYNLQTSNAPVPTTYYSQPYTGNSTAYRSQLQPQFQSQAAQTFTAAHDEAELSDSQGAMPPRKLAPAAKQDEIDPSPVRTKFPTARIKRIMQADEEVGKVAQQTPIAVGKALELFMVQLVRKSAEVAREKNSKRITAPMLKQAVGSVNEWDFLLDIVSKVNEEKEGAKGSRSKQESESDEEADGGEVKKKGRGGRKKKAPA